MDLGATPGLCIVPMCTNFVLYLLNKMTTLNSHSDTATRQERLAGNELLDYVKATSELTHTQRCLGAGYIQATKYEDGTDKPAFTDFFEAILDAKKEFDDNTKEIYANSTEDSMTGVDWYDSLTEEQQELYDAIEDMCPEFTKFDAEQCQEFMDELDDLGITTADQFKDAHFYQTDSHNPEAEFAQFYAEEIACLDVANEAGMFSFIVIDWQATWDCNLRYDFNTIEFDGETYFFQNL